MRKKLAVLAFVAAAMGASAPSWAFTSVGRSTFTAGVFTAGVNTATATIRIRDVASPYNGINRSSITWSNVAPPNTGWKIADRLFLIQSTVTDAGGGLQIYTRNTEADASPSFADPTPGDLNNADSNPAGLLRGLSGSTGQVLPVAWSIKDSSRTVESGTVVTGIGAADPNTGPGTAVFNNRFQWLFMADRATPNIPSTNTNAFSDGAPYHTMVNVVGIHYGQADAEFAPTADGIDTFVYLEANFSGAAAQTPYQTTTMTIETFVQ